MLTQETLRARAQLASTAAKAARRPGDIDIAREVEEARRDYRFVAASDYIRHIVDQRRHFPPTSGTGSRCCSGERQRWLTQKKQPRYGIRGCDEAGRRDGFSDHDTAGADKGGVDAISSAYQAGLIKRVRPTRAQTAHLRESLYQIVDESKPTGIRFVYYRAVARGLVEKSDGGYDKVQYALKQLRENGTIPWGWIVDSSRWVRRPRTFDDAADALTDMARGYVRNIWSDADAVVEVWCESKSAAGVLAPVTFKWGVDLFPITGQTSDSFAYEAAQDHLLDHRPLQALYVGDLDPAGVEIELNLLQKLRRFGRGDLGFTRLACTPDQVIEYDLIGTTPKKPTYKNTITGERLPWHGMAYEVEGIDAPVLRDVVEEAIVSHLDPFRLDAHRMVEAQELAGLRAMANGWSV